MRAHILSSHASIRLAFFLFRPRLLQRVFQRNIKIPIQGGLDPKILLTDKETLKKEAFNYLESFKDHPYIFNLGHGILPETNPEMVENLIKIVKDFK